MIVGVPKETKADEYRIALMPIGARLLCQDGHDVVVQSGAGAACGFTDEEYEQAGAKLVPSAANVFDQASLILKVKEPQVAEISMLGAQHIVFGYFHFAGDRNLTEACLQSGFTAVAYETLQGPAGDLPLLTPMSEVAGRLSIQSGAKHLEQPAGGRGVLLGGVPGVAPACVVILGGGVVGSNAASMAAGLGAEVLVLDVNLATLRSLGERLPANVTPLFSDPQILEQSVLRADLVIGAVLLPGKTAPHLITRQVLGRMKPGCVVVDVCIDQGGCLESSRPTTHTAPTFVESEIVHYCVPNMPAAVGRTSTRALCNATLPYVRRLAGLGVDNFLATNSGHASALNLRAGKIAYAAVAEAFPDLAS